MDSSELKSIGIRACEDMYEQMSALQKGMDPNDSNAASMKVNEIKSIERRSNELIISLIRGISDTDGLGLCIDDKNFYFNDSSELSVSFDEYDEKNKTIHAYPSQKLMNIINKVGDDRIKIVVDMKWLISLTRDCFEKYGDNLGYPSKRPCFKEDVDYTFPKGSSPSQEQRDAVRTILNSRLSYIWGAPGTGKTQYVLATSIIAYIKKGKRVAIIAPTNNAVEQVLRGVLKVIEQDDPDHTYIDPAEDILRMGSATSEFIKDYPGMCEDAAIMAKIRSLRRSNQIMDSILFERKLEMLKRRFSDILDLFNKQFQRTGSYDFETGMMVEIDTMFSRAVSFANENSELRSIAYSINRNNLRNDLQAVYDKLESRDRSVLNLMQYKNMSDSELLQRIDENNVELKELEPFDTAFRVKNVRIMAMTPFILMGRSSLFEKDGVIDVDHIFIDEAGYANLIQTMPVFMCGPPVAMLGDHMQLPPVCELERENILIWAGRGDYMQYSFMWDQSARYLESYLFGTIEDARDDYIYNRKPRYKETATADLTCSHRFADNLAKILDECVYMNGISGNKDASLQLMCYDVKGLNPESRANLEEADAIAKFVKDNVSELTDFAIITPYNDQKKAITEKCGERYKDDIFTIHGSQGREWDTVIISVSDNSTSNKKNTYRFTSSLPPYDGLNVINTAVSRAKKKLIIFCDQEFWSTRASRGDLLGRLVSDKGTAVIYSSVGFKEYIEFMERKDREEKIQNIEDQHIIDDSKIRIDKLRIALSFRKDLFINNDPMMRGILKDAGVSNSELIPILAMIGWDQMIFKKLLTGINDISVIDFDSMSKDTQMNELVLRQLVSDIVDAHKTS